MHEYLKSWKNAQKHTCSAELDARSESLFKFIVSSFAVQILNFTAGFRILYMPIMLRPAPSHYHVFFIKVPDPVAAILVPRRRCL